MQGDVGVEKLKDKVFQIISVLTEVRKRLCCPECNSTEYYNNHEYVESHPIYDDNYEEDDMEKDYCHSYVYCNECGYSDY